MIDSIVYAYLSTALLHFACRNLVTSVSDPNEQSKATLVAFHKTSTALDSRKSRHKIVHAFEVWGAKDKAGGESEELQHEGNHEPSSVSVDRESVPGHLHELVDMEHSEEHRVAELIQVLLKRRVRMEQELAQGMHLLHTMRMNSPGPGDWMRADSESNLVSQDDVGYQYQTVEHHSPASTDGKVSHSHALPNTCVNITRNPAVPNPTKSDSRMVEGTNLVSPTHTDSPLLSPAAGSYKRHAENPKPTKNEEEPSMQKFVFNLPGEAVEEMNRASK